MMNEADIRPIDRLFDEPVYADSPETEALFCQALQEELVFHYEHNEPYRRFCDRKGFDPHKPLKSLTDIPPVAVSVFKEMGFDLASVPREDIRLRLQSSATSGIPSTIVVDKITSKRQAKAMVKVMQEFIGKDRKPFLVMDIDPRSEFRSLLGARFAAITGYLNFASQAGYFLKAKDGVSYFDIDAIQAYVSILPADQPVVVFGFTYILYANVLKAFQEKGVTVQLPAGSKIIHIGGWKKLEGERIDKALFNERMAGCFGLQPVDVIDIYGFTEQMGLNYPDCPCGCKHTSSYVRVLTHDVTTNDILPPGQEGKLEFVTPIPHSYPGNAVLTDDLGIIYDEPCPFGRPGVRFRVTGRLKKAEIRGCGDVLSSKLAFVKSQAGKPADKRLDIQFFQGNIAPEETPEQQLRDIVRSLRATQDWLSAQPVEALVGLIGKAAEKWLSDEAYRILKDKGLLFLSTWCSASHLKEMAAFGLHGDLAYLDRFLPFPDSDRHFLKATPRGLVCHWMAGNVQILGFFALVQSILAKNVNLIKVSSRDQGVFSLLLNAFKDLTYTTESGCTIEGNRLLDTIAVIYFSREAITLGELMSSSADVRIAWGGQEAVQAVASLPSLIGSETVIFGPKLSFAVISKERLENPQDVKKLARRVSIDISVFDQTGCASPHNLFIERGGAISPEAFCEILQDSMKKTAIQIPKDTVSPEQMASIHSIRGVYDFMGKTYGDDTMQFTILLDDHLQLHAPVYSRVIFVHTVDNIEQALPFITEDIQTIGIEAPQDRAEAFAEKAVLKGAARFPQIGRMLNFEMPWDGISLIERLVRWNTLLGPLR